MESFELDNGLKVLFSPNPNLHHTVINVFYAVGSAQESIKNTGLAHFLEHMMFEGSKQFPHFDRSLQNWMAENNAFTGQDYTCYYEIFPKDELPNIIAIEYDRMFHLNLSDKNIELQKKIILEEFKETSLNPPLADAWHYIQALCFSNSYQWPVIGKTLRHISSIDKAMLKEFYHSYYRPENAIISIIGNHAVEEIKQSLSLFNNHKKNKYLPNNLPKLNSKKSGYKVLKRKNITQPCFFLAIHIADYAQREYFVADMISDLLTHGESSLLYHDLIIVSKYCTEINSYTTDNLHGNLLVIEGKLSENTTIDLVIDKIRHSFDKLKRQPISDIQLETLTNKAKSYWSFYHYNTSHLAQNMCLFYKSAGVQNIPQYLDKIYTSIQVEDLKTFAIKHFNLSHITRLDYLPA